MDTGVIRALAYLSSQAKPCLAIARLNMLIILNANDCDLPGGVGDDAGGGCAGQTRVGGDGEAQHAVQLDLKAK